ncbi:hypothetical protein MES4922_190384 [Mesorhizobium ventifaucium]|uniref:Uncharacterized protein n=1 Tax=Mesorhizobium ventifaucium TaxID=666020 RepID=A0ABN8JHT6_9HYPH|nr:hypothetical protein MES4922_190384 [Mesorhizobium ventifaucium]
MSTAWRPPSLREKLGRERWADASRGRRDAPLAMIVDLSRPLVKRHAWSKDVLAPAAGLAEPGHFWEENHEKDLSRQLPLRCGAFRSRNRPH